MIFWKSVTFVSWTQFTWIRSVRSIWHEGAKPMGFWYTIEVEPLTKASCAIFVRWKRSLEKLGAPSMAMHMHAFRIMQGSGCFACLLPCTGFPLWYNQARVCRAVKLEYPHISMSLSLRISRFSARAESLFVLQCKYVRGWVPWHTTKSLSFAVTVSLFKTSSTGKVDASVPVSKLFLHVRNVNKWRETINLEN